MEKSKSKSKSEAATPMATFPGTAKLKSEAAKWTLADETALISTFLYDHCSTAGDSATFKTPTFHEAAPLLDAIWTEGGPKTGSALFK